MLYRALSRRDNNWKSFTFDRTPLRVTEESFACTKGNFNNELLDVSTVSRGNSYTGVFEGDKIIDCYDSLVVGYVIFSAGFRMLKDDGSITNIPTDLKYRVDLGDADSIGIISKSEHRTPLVFIINGTWVKDIYSIMRDDITNVLRGVYDMTTVKAYTGFQDKSGVSIFFGQTDDAKICIHKNDVCVYKDNVYKRIRAYASGDVKILNKSIGGK